MKERSRDTLLRTLAFLFWIFVTSVAGRAQDVKQAGERVDSREPFQEKVVREIEDPHTGDRWLLLRDRDHAGPGRMVLAGKANRRATEEPGNGISSRPRPQKPAMALPVIHTGDRVTVEENSPDVRARLEAVALGNAPIGGRFNVRLAIGNKVVTVIAVSGGRADLVHAKETWR